LPDVKSVWPVIIRCDLDGQPHAIAKNAEGGQAQFSSKKIGKKLYVS